MTTPYDPIIKMQQALWGNWLEILSYNLETFARLYEHQSHLCGQQPYFRFHDVISQGADWFDHYGRRNHDIDVEKV